MILMMMILNDEHSSAAAVTKGVGQIASREVVVQVGGRCKVGQDGWWTAQGARVVGQDGWVPACFMANLLPRQIENKSHWY